MWPWSPQRVLIALEAECLDPIGFDKVTKSILTSLTTDSFGSEVSECEITGTCTDSRKIFGGCLFVALKGEVHDGHDHILVAFEKGAAFCLGHRDWSGWGALPEHYRSRCFLTNDVIKSFRSLAQSMRKTFAFPVIGIGGSNGKTTTKEILKAMLSRVKEGSFISATIKSENGFLGTAITLTKPELRAERPPVALILEIGIDETGAMAQHVQLSAPDTVLLTALGPEHLAGLGSWQNAIDEELLLFGLSSLSKKIWQGDEPALAEKAKSLLCSGDTWVSCIDAVTNEKSEIPASLSDKVSKLTWSSVLNSKESSEILVGFSDNSEGKLFNGVQVKKESFENEKFLVPLPGKHNAQNFALAFGVALSLGLSVRQVRDGLKTFVPPALRSKVESFDRNNSLFLDCYNSSPSSLEAALDLMKAPQWHDVSKVFFLGDMLDLGTESNYWHLRISNQLEGIFISRLCLIGNAMYALFKNLKKTLNENPLQNDPEGSKVVWFENAGKVDLDLVFRPGEIKNTVVLVKGSRGVGLEVLEEPLRRRFFLRSS